MEKLNRLEVNKYKPYFDEKESSGTLSESNS
jgi:hypothetical protein